MLKKLKILVEIENDKIQVQLQEHRMYNHDAIDITHADTTEDVVAAVKNYKVRLYTSDLTTATNL